MANKILTISISSPAQLSDYISKLSLSEKKKYTYISLVIEGADILVCPFHFPQGSIKEIRQRIRL